VDDAARTFLLGRGNDLRFEVFMDELGAHADPTFGHGRTPEIKIAARLSAAVRR